MLRGNGFDDLVQPVGIRIEDGVVSGPVVLKLGVVIHPGAAGDGQFGVVGRGIEHGIRHLNQTRRLLEAEVVVEDDVGGLIVFASLGGHEDDAVCRTRAVDSGGCILQHGHALDFLTGQAAEFFITARHAVDDDERRVGAQRAAAADEHNGIVAPGLTGTVVHDDTGKTACKALGHVHRGVLHQFVTGSRGDRACKSEFSLVAITNGHCFIEHKRIIFQDEIDHRPALNTYHLLFIAHKAGDDAGI